MNVAIPMNLAFFGGPALTVGSVVALHKFAPESVAEKAHPFLTIASFTAMVFATANVLRTGGVFNSVGAAAGTLGLQTAGLGMFVASLAFAKDGNILERA